MKPLLSALLLLAACGEPSAPAETTPDPSTQPQPTGATTQTGTEQTEPTEPAEQPAQDQASPTERTLSIRIELEHPEMREGGDPGRDIEARLDAVLYVRNNGSTERTLTATIPASFELEWQITAADGTRWQPTFLPPPVPRPGGPPTNTVTIAPGAEARLADLHGISGFIQEGAPVQTRRGTPPAGTYQVAVSGVTLEGARLAAPPVTLTVRR